MAAVRLDRVVGKYSEVHPHEVPDVADRH